jgi:GTPase
MNNILLINLFPPTYSVEQARNEAAEMYQLVSSLGDCVVVDMLNQRGYPAKGAYIGTGKALEAVEKVKETGSTIVLLNGIAKPRQLYTLVTTFERMKCPVQVWDRIDLILRIFEKHAHTAEARLQIELAHMRHMGPRIYGMGHVLSQQAGGIGTRGIGETNVELMKRHWRDAIGTVRKKLEVLEKTRKQQIAARKKTGKITVSIIGYTNAGKTTLYNVLTKKNKYADNVLFATLDSTVGLVYLPNIQQEVFVSDTIGFIRHLPPSLIDAFTSTLMESVYADVLMHVVDGSSPEWREHYQAVAEIKTSLGIEEKPEILVVHKCDALSTEQRETLKQELHGEAVVFVSSKTREGIDALITCIEHRVHHTSERTVSPIPLTFPEKEQLHTGMKVSIVPDTQEDSGMLKQGYIKKILTRSYSHPEGIKVLLRDGSIGRVKKIEYIRRRRRKRPVSDR